MLYRSKTLCMTELSMGAISVMCFKVMVFFKNLSKKKKVFFSPPKSLVNKWQNISIWFFLSPWCHKKVLNKIPDIRTMLIIVFYFIQRSHYIHGLTTYHLVVVGILHLLLRSMRDIILLREQNVESARNFKTKLSYLLNLVLLWQT